MTAPSPDLLGVFVLLAGAAAFLGQRAWKRFRPGRRTTAASPCGGCTGCASHRISPDHANRKDDASCQPTTRDAC